MTKRTASWKVGVAQLEPPFLKYPRSATAHLVLIQDGALILIIPAIKEVLLLGQQAHINVLQAQP